MTQGTGGKDDLRARVLAMAKEPAPTRAEVRRNAAWTIAIGFAGLAVVFFALGGFHVGRRPDALVLTTAVGWGAVAALATFFGLGRGRSMLGRPRIWLVVLAMLTPIALFASALFLRDAGWPETASIATTRAGDIKCFLSTAAFAAGPLLAFLLVRRRSDPVHPRAAAAAIGAAAGAWAGLMIHLHCDVESTAHLGAAHVLPVLLAAALGALVGNKVLGVRRV
jgi:hypothetical protein